ncbi:hypothetical protein EV702DRAFT_1048902 [Suillus placidus]|uniref:Uncharacterized protein n=1 Tax=Suillus placidus TaxID=48579 RepID=A0A9P6ZMC5_9AGAM|nr:hypothetical protein EV702DRAFT_1048902 [Suillus placidus]
MKVNDKDQWWGKGARSGTMELPEGRSKVFNGPWTELLVRSREVQAPFSIFQVTMILLFTLTDLLGYYHCSVIRLLAPCTKQAPNNEIDASDIVFYNDPDNNVPLPQVPSSAQSTVKDAFSVLLKAGCIPALVAAGSRCSTHTSKPSAHVWDADNMATASSSRKHPLSDITDPPAPKKATMRFLSPLDFNDKDEGNNEGVPSSPLPKKSPCMMRLFCTQMAMTTMTKPNLGMEMPLRQFPKVNVQQISVPYSLTPQMGGSATCARPLVNLATSTHSMVAP